MNLKKVLLGLTFLGHFLTGQSQNIKKAEFKIIDSSGDRFILELTLEDFIIDLDETGDISGVDLIKSNNHSIQYWAHGWGTEKEGKIKSVGAVSFDYWGHGWGIEKEGKIKSIDKVAIDYWGNGNGPEKEGKIKSVDKINIDYWGHGNGAEREGKIKSADAINIDYWGRGYGSQKEGRVRSIEGNNEKVFATAL